MDTTRTNDHRCTICNSACSACIGPSTAQCQSCNSVTILDINNVTVTKMYYKDLDSDTCADKCPEGQFISTIIQNECVRCNASCVKCSESKLNCTKCALDYYLY